MWSKPLIRPPAMAFCWVLVLCETLGIRSVAFASGRVEPSVSVALVAPSHLRSWAHSWPSTLSNVWFS
jgi:hypothetical protein